MLFSRVLITSSCYFPSDDCALLFFEATDDRSWTLIESNWTYKVGMISWHRPTTRRIVAKYLWPLHEDMPCIVQVDDGGIILFFLECGWAYTDAEDRHPDSRPWTACVQHWCNVLNNFINANLVSITPPKFQNNVYSGFRMANIKPTIWAAGFGGIFIPKQHTGTRVSEKWSHRRKE